MNIKWCTPALRIINVSSGQERDTDLLRQQWYEIATLHYIASAAWQPRNDSRNFMYVLTLTMRHPKRFPKIFGQIIGLWICV
jgi:hypothetical protein